MYVKIRRHQHTRAYTRTQARGAMRPFGITRLYFSSICIPACISDLTGDCILGPSLLASLVSCCIGLLTQVGPRPTCQLALCFALALIQACALACLLLAGMVNYTYAVELCKIKGMSLVKNICNSSASFGVTSTSTSTTNVPCACRHVS